MRKHGKAVRNRLPFNRLAPRSIFGTALPGGTDCSRSGAAGGAVRGCSSSPRPVPMQKTFAWSDEALAGVALGFVWCLDLHCLLTPTRASAKKISARFAGPNGSGGWVASATTLQPRCNHQSTDIAPLFTVVAELRAQASRDVRVRVCACTRACRGGQNLQLLQPLKNSYILELVSGCKMVARRLRLQPRQNQAGSGTSCSLGMNILVAGYAGLRSDAVCSGVKGGRVAQTFGVFGRRCASAWARSGGGSIDGEKAGIAGVCEGQIAPVGRVMLEGLTKAQQLQGLARLRRQPIGLLHRWSTAGSAGGGGDRPAAPPLPPSRARQSPCTQAQAIFSNWNGVSASPDHIRLTALRVARTRQGWAGTIGSGCGNDRGQSARRMRGQGMMQGFGLRRFCDGNAGAACVN